MFASWLLSLKRPLRSLGPFLNLSDLSIADARAVLGGIKARNATFAAQRYDGYLERRAELERMARRLFVEKGGRPVRERPHYMVVGSCDWLKSWYLDAACVNLPVSAFDPLTLSFTYGDMFPTFSPRVTDGREYRGQLYTYAEILRLIGEYGLPQDWNPDGRLGPERYVEVQVWDDVPLNGR